ATVEVWGGPDKDHLKLLGTAKGVTPPVPGQSVATDTFCDFKATPVSYLHIKCKNQGWLLVDEVFLN
ncbi:MAG: hypothetical protein AAGC65_25805, partial [Mucilaginibacter sp.]|uniref:hypothetical protein n=1 Tax=Mucilaginibacter sp. TaxID=1882438 RepID=UPI0031A62A8C